MVKTLFLALGLVMAASAARAQDLTSPPAQVPGVTGTAAASAPAAPDALICHRGAPPTGTRIGATRICHTREEWQTINQNAEVFMRAVQNSGSGYNKLSHGNSN